MKQELEDKLFKEYSEIFPSGRDVDMRENLMCFGFSHGDGWYTLLDELFTDISILLKSGGQIDIIQVKEKFGALRIYFNLIKGTEIIRESIYELIRKTERKSTYICEVCGKDGKCVNRNGWISTVCKEHEKRNEDWDG